MSNRNVAVANKDDVVLLPLAEMKSTIFVRRHLNEDRVLQFMELYDNGSEVPPIKVIRGSMEIEAGRHRYAALGYLDRKHAECLLVEPGNKPDLLMRAFADNFGGSLPPSRLDIVFVVRQLLEEGLPHRQITDLFANFYKPSHMRKLLKDAHSALSKTKMQKAKNAVAHGDASVKEAAKCYGVELETLQGEITGVKKKRSTTSVTDIRREISNRNRGNTLKSVAIFRSLFDQFEDGEMSEKDVFTILTHVKRLNMDTAKRVDQWFERFEALKGSVKAKS